MTLDARRLARALAERGPVARVVVAGTRGSVPREAGAEMLVWADGQDGTIGGGALEFEAARAARAMLAACGIARPASGPPGHWAGATHSYGEARASAATRPHDRRSSGDVGAAGSERREGGASRPGHAASTGGTAPAATARPDGGEAGAHPPSDAARRTGRTGRTAGAWAGAPHEDEGPRSGGAPQAPPRAVEGGGASGGGPWSGSERDGPASPSGSPLAPDARPQRAATGRAPPRARLTRHPLGPALGQCCGGAVSLVTEVIAETPTGPGRALRVEGRAPEPPGGGATHGGGATRIADGWLVEPVVEAGEPLWIWGAGHVGRALVATLGPLGRFEIAWIDVAEDRFPEGAPGRVVAADPPALAARAPRGARHLIVTHSHAIDLALCHALLARGFASCGLIGSATKWARFRSRLRALGHSDTAIGAIDCPIGEPTLGKHPQAIAIGVAAEMLRPAAAGRMQARA